MPQGTPRRTRDKDAKQRALLEAARDVFREHGYERATTKEMARRAGCSESLIFRYFRDKQGIFEHLSILEAESALDRCERAIAQDYPASFDAYVRALFLSRSLDKQEVTQWDIAARGLTDPVFAAETIAPVHRERIEVVTEGIRHYQALGAARSDVDAAELAELIGNMINITAILGPRLFQKEAPRTQREIDFAVDLVVAAAMVDADRPPPRPRNRTSR